MKPICFLFLSVTRINPCLKQQRYQKKLQMTHSSFHGSDLCPFHDDFSFDCKGSGVTESVSHRWLDLDFSEQDFGDTKTVYFLEEELLA